MKYTDRRSMRRRAPLRAAAITGRPARWAASASVFALACAGWAGAASAQDANQVPSGQVPAQAAGAAPQSVPAAGPTSIPSPASTSSTVQEVVVTAERRAVNIQTTAISMTAISGNQLQEKQVQRISDLQTQAPGLSFTASSPTANINIRGLGNTTISPGVTTGVAVFRDGLYEPEAILLNEPFYDIADVEVERGPQGTIVGQNSTGGALLITSRNPNFDGLNGYLEGDAGSHVDRKADGAINLPITDTLAARFAFNVESRGSFFRDVGAANALGSSEGNDQPGQVQEQNARIGILWRPTEHFQILAKAELNRNNTGGYTYHPLPNTAYYNYGYSNTPASLKFNPTPGPYTLDFDFQPTDMQIADRYSIEARYKFDDGITIRSLSGLQHLNEYYNNDGDASAYGFRHNFHNIGPSDNYLGQEIDVLSPDQGRFTWLFGGSYFYRSTPVHDRAYGFPNSEAGSFTPNIAVNFPLAEALAAPTATNPAGGAVNAAITSTCPYATCNLYSESSTTSIQRLGGIFGQASFQIIPTVQLQVGARYSFDDNQNGGYTLQGFGTPRIQLISGDGHYSRNVPTGKVTLNWTPIEGQFFYAFVARGYKEGGINNFYSTFNPEYVNDYEGGWKGRLFDGHVQTQLGGYYMQYSGMQQQTTSPITGTALTTNLGNSTIAGVEASMQAKFDRLTFDAGLAYNYSKLGPITAIAPYLVPSTAANLSQCATGQTAGCYNYNAPTGAYGANVPGSPVAPIPGITYPSAYVNLSGEKDPYSPTLTFNISVAYVFDLGPGTLTPRINFAYVGDQYASIFQHTPVGTESYELSARHLLDAFVTYAVGKWEVEPYVRNLTNQIYVAGIAGANGYFGDPRTYGIRVERSF